MNVLFVAAEVAPLTKVGGLADVVRSLPAELRRRGHDVRIMVPRYGFGDYSAHEITPVMHSLTVLSLGEYQNIAIERTVIDDIPVYLLSSDTFARADSVYGGNETARFWTFCEAVSETISYLGWRPSIVHCHDWHTSLVPLLARKNREDYRTVLTVHNVRYQGYFDEQFLDGSGLGQYWNAGIPQMPCLPWNLLVQGVLWADRITAVSENFAREMLTVEGGHGLQNVVQFRHERLSGICNGLGNEEYDPQTDGHLAAKYSSGEIEGKRVNKRKLQTVAGWEEDDAIPLFGMVSRLDEQKGMDIILEAVPELLKGSAAQFIFLGHGNGHYEEGLRRLQARYPGRVRSFVTFDNEIAHLVYAGSNLFLMPSKWEPCGLGQLIAMRYGTAPVVRRTGGLADTVTNLTQDMKRGTGFMFDEFAAEKLVATMARAVEYYRDRVAWTRMAQRIMKQDFGWARPAIEYERVYEKALEAGVNET
jgi:starch synthase